MSIVHHTGIVTPAAGAVRHTASPWKRKLLVALAIVAGATEYVGAQSAIVPVESTPATSGRGAPAQRR